MTTTTRSELLEALLALEKGYRGMRFGQLTCMVCAMADGPEPPNIDEPSDQLVLSAIRGMKLAPVHTAGEGDSLPLWLELAKVLEELGSFYPQWSLGKLLAWVASMGHLNIYDAEDEQLLEAARSILAKADWFESYMGRLEHESTICNGEAPYRCPCCHHLSLSERGGFEICPICYWEDDGQDDHDADVVRGGPNRALSLGKARENYEKHKVCDLRFSEHVRPPRPEEV